MALNPVNYESNGFSIQRSEITSILQPMHTDQFIIYEGQNTGGADTRYKFPLSKKFETADSIRPIVKINGTRYAPAELEKTILNSVEVTSVPDNLPTTSISQVNIVDAGNGYFTANHSVIITPSQSDIDENRVTQELQVAVTIDDTSGTVTAVSVTQEGLGYTTSPTITVTNADGSETVSAVLESVVEQPQINYTITPNPLELNSENIVEPVLHFDILRGKLLTISFEEDEDGNVQYGYGYTLKPTISFPDFPDLVVDPKIEYVPTQPVDGLEFIFNRAESEIVFNDPSMTAINSGEGLKVGDEVTVSYQVDASEYESSHYLDGLMRQLARDLTTNPYNPDAPNPFHLVFPANPPKDENGKQSEEDLEKAISKINNVFVVESEEGVDLLSSSRLIKPENENIPPLGRETPNAQRKPQKWRIRFFFDETTGYLNVHIATNFQILDDGRVTGVSGRDGMISANIREPGELCDVYYSVGEETVKAKSGFFRRGNKRGENIRGTYPLTYKLTVTDHGMMFYVYDQSSTETDTNYAWFVVQRHVDNRSGRPEYEDGYSPVHCVYSPSKRQSEYGNPFLYVPKSYYSTDPTEALPLKGLFDAQGSMLSSEYPSYKSWIVGENVIKYDDRSGLSITYPNNTSGPKLTDYSDTDFVVGTDGKFPILTFPKYLDTSGKYSTIAITAAGYEAIVPWILGKADSPNLTDVIPPKPEQPEKFEVSIDGSMIYAAQPHEYRIDTVGNVEWKKSDTFGENQYVWVDRTQILHLRYTPPAGSRVTFRFYTYTDGSSPTNTFYIKLPEDPDFPNYNMNDTKAIYRFIVREKDVFTPTARHKSATMNQVDSPAIINPMEQVSITPKRTFVYTFPNPLTSNRYLYPDQELDMLCFSSAESSAFTGLIKVGTETSPKYDLDAVQTVGETGSFSGDTLDWRQPYTWHTADKYRLYEGMMSTLPNGNGMRVFMLVKNGPVKDSDVDETAIMN